MVNWKRYFKTFLKKIWIVIVITGVCVSIASYLSFYKIKPKYQATTKLIVLVQSQDNSTRINYDDLLASLALVNDYKEMITSQSVTSEVIKQLNLNQMTDAELAKIIDVVLVPNSSVIDISVQAGDPDLAVNITKEVTNVFIRKVSELLHQNNISIVSEAVLPKQPVSPRPMLIIEFSFLTGIILSMSLILALVYFDEKRGDLEILPRSLHRDEAI